MQVFQLIVHDECPYQVEGCVKKSKLIVFRAIAMYIESIIQEELIDKFIIWVLRQFDGARPRMGALSRQVQ